MLGAIITTQECVEELFGIALWKHRSNVVHTPFVMKANGHLVIREAKIPK